MKITPVAASFGALVEDVQLGAINERQFEALYQAFLHYKVLFFRDQLLTAEQHLAIGQCFGELEPIHPFFPHLADAPQNALCFMPSTAQLLEAIRFGPTWKRFGNRLMIH